ncbi:hypothetical protein BD779DRAFT_1038928 [Infundibulicybe gibba]|nr:hypothetical protein BD779DRAFT_1038928 [Infundibulicybe gibba]
MSDTFNYGYSILAFPPEFLGGSAPNLRHMKLSTRCCIPWDSGLFAHLATLDVSGSENLGRDSPSLSMLLCALARMPELETLILNRCLPPPALSKTVGARVNISKLKRLEVVSALAHCTYFLRQITINASATVLLNIKYTNVSMEDVEDFFTVFPSHLYTTSTPVAQALKFTWDDPDDFEIDVWTVQQNTEFENLDNASIKLVFNWKSIRSREVSPQDLTWACFAALVSPQLRSFHISGGVVEWDAEMWRRLARATPDLQRLATGTKVQCVELFKALSPDVPDLALGDCCFPALSYLELESSYDCRMPNPDGGESPLSVFIARSLAIRASIGYSTPELVFIKKDDYYEDWFKPFDAVPGLIVHMRERRRELEMAAEGNEAPCNEIRPKYNLNRWL